MGRTKYAVSAEAGLTLGLEGRWGFHGPVPVAVAVPVGVGVGGGDGGCRNVDGETVAAGHGKGSRCGGGRGGGRRGGGEGRVPGGRGRHVLGTRINPIQHRVGSSRRAVGQASKQSTDWFGTGGGK